jgi:hypothetical protein
MEMTQYFVNLSLDGDGFSTLMEALSCFQEHCEQQLAKGETWPFERHIQTIQKIQAEVNDELRRADEEYIRWNQRGKGETSR